MLPFFRAKTRAPGRGRASHLLMGLGIAMTLQLATGPAHAFTHVVQPGDTLASLAERFYGKIQHERLLVAANALEVEGGIRITPGMLLEVPALTYVRVRPGQTWKELAQKFLGGEHRAYALAEANEAKAWIPPATDLEVAIPFNLRFVSTGNETIVGLAYRYLGDRKKAWMLDQYNERKGRRLVRGEVVLIPVVDVALTEQGKQDAAVALQLGRQELAGADLAAQRQVSAELSGLENSVREARYVQAVEHGTRCLNLGQLTEPQRARIHRALLEAYVALGAPELAASSCGAWLKADPKAKLDPMLISPKILSACEGKAP
jgi:LysM domain